MGNENHGDQTEGKDIQPDDMTLLELKEQELSEIKTKYVRLEADFINFRRRNSTQRQELIQKTKRDMIINFIQIMDNMERAFASIKTASSIDNIKQGLNLIQMQFQNFLNSEGINRMVVKDQAFNPEFHEAVMSVEDPEITQETVIEELLPGYMLDNKIIRPAKVKVATPPAKEEGHDTE